MLSCHPFVIFLFLFLISFQSWASDLEVRWGNGTLEIIANKNQKPFVEDLKVLETELLIDSRLGQEVLTSSLKSIKIPIDSSKNIESIKETIVKAILKKAKLSRKIQPQQQTASKYSATEDDLDKSSGSHFTISSSQFEMNNIIEVVGPGTKKTIAEGEFVDTLVVIGGEVVVEGEIAHLILLKGRVNLKGKGQVSQSYVKWAGSLEKSDQSFLTKNRSGIFQLLKIPTNLLSGLLDFKDWKLSWSLVFFRLAQSLFLFWFSFLILPYMRLELFTKKQNWGYSFFLGMVQVVFLPFVSFLLLISILGISVLPFYWTILYVFWMLGYALVCAALGVRCVRQVFGHENERSKYLYFFVGFVICELLFAAPFAGYVIFILVSILSLGRVSELALGRWKTKPT